MLFNPLIHSKITSVLFNCEFEQLKQSPITIYVYTHIFLDRRIITSKFDFAYNNIIDRSVWIKMKSVFVSKCSHRSLLSFNQPITSPSFVSYNFLAVIKMFSSYSPFFFCSCPLFFWHFLGRYSFVLSYITTCQCWLCINFYLPIVISLLFAQRSPDNAFKNISRSISNHIVFVRSDKYIYKK